METKIIELTIDEAKQITGGGLYEASYAVGKYCADTIDFWHGVFDGLLG